ncbi:hypothetical protein BESB_007350 [Besnoitia besnoiti]|uniref:GDP-fucose protein O-fucosyltransferase n=1 Tax=Besnoitia besnoiti TaxID=94643 RepID=A0A2A9MQA8_BESBE|nr:hypothetical protein BESB_007350 [Besnoitia besnoiti]PFH38393.1 hypothetical protein BESB_007350 [Besnoitia besnoiti]
MRERVPLMEFEDFLIYQQKRLDPWGDRKMETRQQAPIAFDLVFSVRFSSTPAARRRSFCACESPASARVSRDSAETQRQDDDVCCEVNKPPASPEIRDSMPPDALQKAQVRRPKGPPAASRAKTEGQCKAGAGDGAASDVDARSEPQCLSGTGSAMEEPESEADEWNGITLWLGGFCTKIQATEMWSAQLYMSDATRVADIIWRSMETRFPGEIQTLWMKSAESLLVPWPKVLLQAHLIDMLYVHPTLREIGDLFISSFLTPKEESEADEKSSRLPHAGVETGQTPAKPAYIAAHLRRSDFIYLNRSVSLRRAAGYLVTTMKAHGVSKAFICTDGTEAEKRELRDAVAEAGAAAAVQSSSFSYNVIFFDLAAVQSLLKAGPARTSRHPPGAKAATSQDGDSARESLPDHSAMLLHPGVSALIEVWIAARAIYFIGTKDSRFSQAIRWERIMLGQTHDSSVEVFCVDNSSAEGGAATKETCMATRSHDPPEGDGRSELRRKYWP